MINRIVPPFALVAVLAAQAGAQVMITEVWENPPGSTDESFEYIELYGRPGMSLDGFALGAFKGGFDTNSDGIPDGGSDGYPEIDEAFSLDGLSLGANGFLVLYNDTASNSLIPGLLPPATARVGFEEAHINIGDTAGKLNNDGSSTYILVRAHLAANFHKDINPDADYDSNIDFGDETGPFYDVANAVAIEPLQRADEIAWSNNGGHEYTASSEQEISDTPGFNPDAVSRMRYFLTNPGLGWRTKDDGFGGFSIVPTRIADESFVYGDIPDESIFNPATYEYDSSYDSDGNRQVKGPTDPNATPYDGTCDPEPFNPGPNTGCTPNPAGAYLFTDYDLDGFAVTPGGYNDGAGLFQIRLQSAQDQGSLPPGFSGQYWLTGDFNMDGVVDCTDVDLISSRLGATLDDTVPNVDPSGQPFDAYRWQNAELQIMLMMLNMNTTDDAGSNNAAVTQADVDATLALAAPAPGPCPGDIDANNTTDVFDFSIFASNFGQSVPCGTLGDLDIDGEVTVFDFAIFASDFGCDAN